MTPEERKAWDNLTEELAHAANDDDQLEEYILDEPVTVNEARAILAADALIRDLEAKVCGMEEQLAIACKWLVASNYSTVELEKIMHDINAVLSSTGCGHAEKVKRLREAVAVDHRELANSMDIGGWDSLSATEQGMIRLTLAELRRRVE